MKIEYNNLYTHFVLTTLHRKPIIPKKNRTRIEKYITGIINNNLSKLYAIYANPEHVHILARGNFVWQQSASAFSVSKSDIDKVCKYILNQPEHHRKISKT